MSGGMSMTLKDGSTFVASTRHVPDVPPFGNFGSGPEGEAKLASWVAEEWNRHFQLKLGENARLNVCELFYSGFHYEDPWQNRLNPVSNYCYSTVETIWPILTETRPRPEPVPRRSMDADRVKRIAMFAQYKMDTSNFDRVFRVSIRDLLKYGWCCPMIGWDQRGNSIARYLAPFDFYPDGASEESEIESFFIARPVATRRLRAFFPNIPPDQIQPDNIASPGYWSLVRPYLEYFAGARLTGLPQTIGLLGPSIATEGSAAGTSSAYIVDTGSFMVYGQTTFVLQFFVRDYTTMKVTYEGDKITPHPQYGELRNPHIEQRDEPCCASGWRMIPMMANGKLLGPPLPVDPCLDGVPLVIGRDYEQGGRFYPKGEIDEIIPIQRGINRDDAVIRLNLELSGNPAVKTTKTTGLGLDKAAIMGGDVLRISPGAMLEFMTPPSVAQAHFEMRNVRRQDIQIVSGTPDALQGMRPAGIEAAAAIRQLTASGTARARSKSNSLLEWGALLLKKMMRADAMKSQDVIYFRGPDGEDAWIHPDDLVPDDFDIRWAEGTGTAQARQDRIDRDFQLAQMGAIDKQELLDELDYPDRKEVLNRMALMQPPPGSPVATNGGGPPR